MNEKTIIYPFEDGINFENSVLMILWIETICINDNFGLCMNYGNGWYVEVVYN